MKKLALGKKGSISISLILSACWSGGPQERYICQTAERCAQIVMKFDDSCTTPYFYSSEKSFVLQNTHNTRKIYVTYEQLVRHVNSSEKDISSIRILSIKPNGEEVLGCWRTKGVHEEQFNQWTYTVRASCFEDECPSPPMTKPKEERKSKSTCEELCKEDDQTCFKNSLGSKLEIERKLQSALYRWSSDLITQAPPTEISTDSITELAKVFSGSSSCWRTPLYIAKPDASVTKFHNDGADCTLGFDVKDDRIDGVEVLLRGQWRGTFETKPRLSYSLVSESQSYSPLLSVLKKDGTREYDPVVKVSGTEQSITFTGENYYCGQINWRGD